MKLLNTGMTISCGRERNLLTGLLRDRETQPDEEAWLGGGYLGSSEEVPAAAGLPEARRWIHQLPARRCRMNMTWGLQTAPDPVGDCL